jgi:hypothetical protein
VYQKGLPFITNLKLTYFIFIYIFKYNLLNALNNGNSFVIEGWCGAVAGNILIIDTPTFTYLKQ